MREGDRERAMQILAAWNMAPRPPSAAQPDPERNELSLTNTFVAEIDGRVVGVASYILRGGGEAETASLAVDPEMRGVAIGERLQRARLVELKRAGVTRVFTETDRPWVIAWYCTKFGYTVHGTRRKRHDFGEAGIDYWTLLELDLGSYEPMPEEAISP